MPTDTILPDLERPVYFDGQRLYADDLTALQTFHQEFRWLHNRSLHGWGVVFGCAVSGARGDRVVHVTAGYALDCLGRELIIVEPLDVTVPPVSGTSTGSPRTYFLTASYREDADAVASRQGVCDTSGAVRREEGARLRWQDPTDVGADSRYRRGLDIVLASIAVQDCKLASDVSTAGRRDALPAERPAVAAERLDSADAAWVLWPSVSAPLGVSVVVPTGSAAFRVVPRYDARITGMRLYNGTDGVFVVDGIAHVEQETATSFRLCVLLPEGFTAGPSSSYVVTENDYMLVIARIITNPNAWILLGAAASILVLLALFALVAIAPLAIPLALAVVETAPVSVLVAALLGVTAGTLIGLGIGSFVAAAVVASIAADPHGFARSVLSLIAAVKRAVRERVGNRLYVGQRLSVPINDGVIGPPVTLSYTIRPGDFDWALEEIRRNNGLGSVGQLRQLNGMQADNDLALEIGVALVVSHASVPLNPSAVITAPFLPKYSSVLGWGVEWIGVEG